MESCEEIESHKSARKIEIWNELVTGSEKITRRTRQQSKGKSGNTYNSPRKTAVLSGSKAYLSNNLWKQEINLDRVENFVASIVSERLLNLRFSS
jgi:hypothetical protein